jgi:hypothetical protein
MQVVIRACFHYVGRSSGSEILRLVRFSGFSRPGNQACDLEGVPQETVGYQPFYQSTFRKLHLAAA